MPESTRSPITQLGVPVMPSFAATSRLRRDLGLDRGAVDAWRAWRGSSPALRRAAAAIVASLTGPPA